MEGLEQIKRMDLRDLMKLDGFRGVEPSAIFGVDFESDFDSLPPLARSYAGIGNALSGQPLDSWARFGMHRERLAEFASFDALTEGQDADERVRTVVILFQYIKDIGKRAPDFSADIYTSETLVSATIWVRDMLRGIDQDTREACKRFGVPGFGPSEDAQEVAEVVVEESKEAPVDDVQAETKGMLRRFFSLLRNL